MISWASVWPVLSDDILMNTHHLIPIRYNYTEKYPTDGLWPDLLATEPLGVSVLKRCVSRPAETSPSCGAFVTTVCDRKPSTGWKTLSVSGTAPARCPSTGLLVGRVLLTCQGAHVDRWADDARRRCGRQYRMTGDQSCSPKGTRNLDRALPSRITDTWDRALQGLLGFCFPR